MCCRNVWLYLNTNIWTFTHTNCVLFEMCDTHWTRSYFYLKDNISWYVFLTRGDSTNIALACKKWINQGLNWNRSLWTPMPDVILWENMIQEFPNLCHSIHFQSNAISKAKHIPAFILLIRRKNNLHLFISEAVWNETRIKWRGSGKGTRHRELGNGGV